MEPRQVVEHLEHIVHRDHPLLAAWTQVASRGGAPSATLMLETAEQVLCEEKRIVTTVDFIMRASAPKELESRLRVIRLQYEKLVPLVAFVQATVRKESHRLAPTEEVARALLMGAELGRIPELVAQQQQQARRSARTRPTEKEEGAGLLSRIAAQTHFDAEEQQHAILRTWSETFASS